MGSNAMIAIVVGAIVVIVGFSLWPVLNAASNNLYSYFRDSCAADGGSGSRFTRIYLGNDAASLPSPLDANAYYTVPGVHGGRGSSVSEDKVNVSTAGGGGATVADDCEVTVTLPENFDVKLVYPAASGGTSIADYPEGNTLTLNLYNEYGDFLGASVVSITAPSDDANATNTGYIRIPKGVQLVIEELGSPATITPNFIDELDNSKAATTSTFTGSPAGKITSWSGYTWIKVADMLQRFSGINNLLLTILPVISIAGFLGVSGAKLYTYGKGASNIGSAISTSIFTLIAVVVAMVIAGPILGSVVDANQVVDSGQFQVNGAFANIITLLFAMIPVIYVAGLVTLVGLQAKSALMGGGKGM